MSAPTLWAIVHEDGTVLGDAGYVDVDDAWNEAEVTLGVQQRHLEATGWRARRFVAEAGGERETTT